ncbi:MAG: hypothetical protein DHS20C21_09180 [Gemmatimonadota bacterium]|nr:MAG: hypothetical protein DHS20C21_09180 [Gemmatimonadota bacterium]
MADLDPVNYKENESIQESPWSSCVASLMDMEEIGQRKGDLATRGACSERTQGQHEMLGGTGNLASGSLDST